MCVLYLKNEAKVMFVYQNQKGGDDVSKNSCAREMDERGESIEEAKKEIVKKSVHRIAPNVAGYFVCRGNRERSQKSRVFYSIDRFRMRAF
jgi:hypothetical protein